VKKEVESHMSEEISDVYRTIEESTQRVSDIRMANAEQEDVESRRNNIILYRVLESDSTLAEDRNKDDNRFCKHFLFGLNIGIVEEDIRKIIRLGKKIFRQCLHRGQFSYSLEAGI